MKQLADFETIVIGLNEVRNELGNHYARILEYYHPDKPDLFNKKAIAQRLFNSVDTCLKGDNVVEDLIALRDVLYHDKSLSADEDMLFFKLNSCLHGTLHKGKE